MFKWKSRSLYVRYLNCIIKGCCILYERFPVSVLVAAELNQSVGGNCKRWWSWSGLWMTENSFFSDHFLNVSSLQPVTEPTAHTTTTTTGWLKISIIFYREGLSVHRTLLSCIQPLCGFSRSVVNLDIQVLIFIHNIHSLSLFLTHVQKQIISPRPCHKIIH